MSPKNGVFSPYFGIKHDYAGRDLTTIVVNIIPPLVQRTIHVRPYQLRKRPLDGRVGRRVYQ